MSQDFNLQLISLVEERPIIWDKRKKDYKQQRLTYEAWRDICKIMEPTFDELTNDKKGVIAKSITKRWTNMKDSWTKCYKKLTSLSRNEAKKFRKYIYYDDMIFLKNVIDLVQFRTEKSLPGTIKISRKIKNQKTNRRINDRKSEEGTSEFSSQTEEENECVEDETNPFECLDVDMTQDDNEDNNSANEISDVDISKNKVKKETLYRNGNFSEVHESDNYLDGEGIWNESNSQEFLKRDSNLSSILQQEFTEEIPDSRIMHFFKSIAPTVDSFSDDDIFNFQFEVLKIIKNIKEK